MLNSKSLSVKFGKKSFRAFAYRNTLAPMTRSKSVQRRREAMGGLAKGLSVIRAFARDRPTLSLSDIAAVTHMPAATTRRCLLTLEELGYVTRSGRQFVLRPKVLELGAAGASEAGASALLREPLDWTVAKDELRLERPGLQAILAPAAHDYLLARRGFHWINEHPFNR
jgi:DNA-binding MarR family transcriptional regulator